MATISTRLSTAAKWLPVLAACSLGACVASSRGPTQVRADSPSVTYNYRTDQDLLQASQNAAIYCSQYQSVERTSRIANNGDGSNTVVFDCVKAPVPAPTTVAVVTTPAPAPMVYTYTTDQQLLDYSRQAQTYCATTPTSSTVVTNANGTRTVTFQCVPR
jgi:hypothetical protein